MHTHLLPCHAAGSVPAVVASRRPLLTPTDVLFCALPVALFLSIVSLV
jgi:hypothetical protein